MMLVGILFGIILIIAILCFVLYLSYKLKYKILKTIIEVILIFTVLLSICIFRKTELIVDSYHSAEQELTKIERITQKRANLLPNYSLDTSKDSAKNHKVEEVRRNYYNQKSQYYNDTINKRVIYLKESNKDFTTLSHLLANSKNKALLANLKRDQELQAQYLKASKKYSCIAHYYNDMISYPIEAQISRHWIPNKENLLLFTYKMFKDDDVIMPGLVRQHKKIPCYQDSHHVIILSGVNR